MPKSLTQYRVFIGSPGGLEEERKLFRRALEKTTELYAEPRDVTFHPVGWEDTISGVGRPQELINKDLRECDYAVFVLHNHWGTPTGGGHSSGTEEEWELAEQLYKETKIRNIALFFRQVALSQMRDPGEDLKKVIAFRKQIEEGKKYLFRPYAAPDDFHELLEAQLAGWLRDHEGTGNALSGERVTISPPAAIPLAAPDQTGPKFDFWIAEANKLMDAEPPNYSGALFCSERTLTVASTEIEWARAKNSLGIAQCNLNKLDEAIAAFAAIVKRLSSAKDPGPRIWEAKALVNKGLALGQLGRSEEGVAVCDEVVARFGSALELPLREMVARALINKGVGLGQLGRGDEAVTVYDDVVARFGSASEIPLREQVARALVNKGLRLGQLGRSEEAITVYDDVVARFGSASEQPLREQVARALAAKERQVRALPDKEGSRD